MKPGMKNQQLEIGKSAAQPRRRHGEQPAFPISYSSFSLPGSSIDPRSPMSDAARANGAAP